MNVEYVEGPIKRIVNRGLQGAVDGGNTGWRFGQIPGGDDGSPGETLRADFYPSGSQVSIENAADEELRIKNELDDLVEAENIHDDPDRVSRKGLPPCKRINRNSNH